VIFVRSEALSQKLPADKKIHPPTRPQRGRTNKKQIKNKNKLLTIKKIKTLWNYF